MDDRKRQLLESIETVLKQLAEHTKNHNTYGAKSRFEQQLADVRACVKRDNLFADVEVTYAVELYENAVVNAAKLDSARQEATRELRALSRQQFNWNAEQESRAYSQMASFSEKLVVVGSGYVAVSISLLSVIKTHLSAGQRLVNTKVYLIFLVIVILEICLAAIGQFAASSAANLILVNTSKMQHEQLSYDMALAFSTSLDEAAKKVASFRSVGGYMSHRSVINLNIIAVHLLVLATIAFGIFVALNVGSL